MTDPNRISPTVIPGWESLKQRATLAVVALLLAFSMLLTTAGRDRLLGWADMAAAAYAAAFASGQGATKAGQSQAEFNQVDQGQEGRAQDQSQTQLQPQTQDSVYAIAPVSLSLQQRRVARWIANRHRVSVDRVEQLVAMGFQTAADFQIDPYLLLALISVESGFNPYAESPVGALGLMQIMPGVHAEKFKAKGGLNMALDPLVNMQVGAQIFREYLDRFGSDIGALRAYVGVPQTSVNEYPNRVLRVRERLIAAAQGRVLA
jgi:soluble lytic murein transglycosylase-like protein